MTTVAMTPAAGSQRHDCTRAPRSTRNTAAESSAQASGGIRRNDRPGEGDDPQQRAADVEAVGLQRREQREGAGHLLRDGAEGGDGEQEDDGERQPPRQWLQAEGPDQRPAAGVRRAGAHRERSTKATRLARRTGATGKRSRPLVPRRKPSPMPRKLASRTKLVRWTR